MEYICIWLVLQPSFYIFNRHSPILFKLHVIIIGCMHIRIHCIQLCIQVHRCHSIIIIVNHQISSLKLKREKNRLNFNGNNRWVRESAVSKETALLLHRWGEWNAKNSWFDQPGWSGRLIIVNHPALSKFRFKKVESRYFAPFLRSEAKQMCLGLICLIKI